MTSPEPHTLIHVRNLQTNLPMSVDAWGRPSPSQPVLISLSVSLRDPFTSSSSTDTVASSTVHYGGLSKSVLQFCEDHVASVRSERSKKRVEGDGGQAGDEAHRHHHMSLEGFADLLSNHLFNDTLDEKVVAQLKLTVFLPKASLLGSGVGFTQTDLPQHREDGKLELEVVTSVLELKELKIPCIIGVNAHERAAKQVVVASVGLENWDVAWEEVGKEDWDKGDLFTALERVVVDAISPSSFQTLEAMTTHITISIISSFLRPLFRPIFRSSASRNATPKLTKYPRIRILLEKPTAVTFADAPAVEAVVESDPARTTGSVRAAWGDL